MQLLRKTQTRRQVERLIKNGVGIRETSWPVDESAADGDLVDSIVFWLRHAMSEMRRPYGIDHVAVALACRDGDGRVLCSNSLGVVRPSMFYGDAGAGRIAAFLDDAMGMPAAKREIVGAVLSLGDIAYELDTPRAA
jgi:hypothetical protein